MKKNPWLAIPSSDYLNHMTEIGQAQVLNRLTKYSIDKYLPKSFALLGCSTGNGLEHIEAATTQKVYAIDINQEYLDKLKKVFQNKIENLEILNLDIQNDSLNLKNIDLCFVALVLEYVDPAKTLKKIIRTLNKDGILFLVIQKTKNAAFVSNTKYASLKKLKKISREVNEKEIESLARQTNLKLLHSEEIELTNNKSFITFEFQLNS